MIGNSVREREYTCGREVVSCVGEDHIDYFSIVVLLLCLSILKASLTSASGLGHLLTEAKEELIINKTQVKEEK